MDDDDYGKFRIERVNNKYTPIYCYIQTYTDPYWPGISGTDQTLQQRFSKGPCELRKPLWVFILRPTLCMGLVISVIGITYCGESSLRLHVII